MSIRSGRKPVAVACRRVAECVQIRFEGARIRSQNDLNVGGGSAAFVDNGAGDRVGCVGGLGGEGAGGESGEAGNAEAQQ